MHIQKIKVKPQMSVDSKKEWKLADGLTYPPDGNIDLTLRRIDKMPQQEAATDRAASTALLVNCHTYDSGLAV